MAGTKGFFAQISKVNLEKRLVTGIATSETLDHDNEIMDYETSKPLFQEWSAKAAQRTGGRSFGNIRVMHQLKIGGHLEEPPIFDDAAKTMQVTAHVDSDEAWDMIQSGSISGFSINGRAVNRWQSKAAGSPSRYTVKPVEISLVDVPCNPAATFMAIKADGSSEQVAFKHDPANDADDEITKAVEAYLDAEDIVKVGRKHSSGTMETVGKAQDALASMGDCISGQCDHEGVAKCSASIADQHKVASDALASFSGEATKTVQVADSKTGEDEMELDQATKDQIAKAATDSAAAAQGITKAQTDSAAALTAANEARDISKATFSALEKLTEFLTKAPTVAKSHSGAGISVVTKAAEGGGEDPEVKRKAQLESKDANEVAKAVLAGGRELDRDELAGLNIGSRR
jgi:hypothetical protein